MLGMRSAITYRKTKTGEWVAYGPLGHLQGSKTITITKANGTVEHREVTKLGAPFTVDNAYMVYAYLVPTRKAAPTRPAMERKRCITGGNCSSFGNSRSCGAEDCDGF